MHNVTIRVFAVAVATLLSIGIYSFFRDRFQLADDRIVDRLVRLDPTGQADTPGGIPEIIHIDANFYADRAYQADIIANLGKMQIAHVLVDTVFNGRTFPEADLALVTETAAAQNVYNGMQFDKLGRQPSITAIRELAKQNRDGRTPDPWPAAVDGQPDRISVGVDPYMPFAELAAASKGIGFLNLAADVDGITRRVPLLARYGNSLYPSIALQVACDFLGVPPENITVVPGRSIRLQSGKTPSGSPDKPIVIPIDQSGRMLLNSSTAWRRVPHYTHRQIHQISDHSEIGTGNAGKIAVLAENVETPFTLRTAEGYEPVSPGTLQVIVLQNILTQSFFRRLSAGATAAVEVLLLIALLALSLKKSQLWLTTGTLSVVAGYAGFGALLFYAGGIVADLTRPLLTIGLAAASLFTVNAVHLALLRSEQEKAKRIADRELQIGREIQSGFFPPSLPVPAGWEIETYFKPARHVAGDFFDVFTFREDERIGIVVADVCDKGVGAALFMALFRSLIRVLAGSVDSDRPPVFSNGMQSPEARISATIGSVNDYIATTHDSASMFATIFFGILDPYSGELHYINAGHEPPLVKGSGGIKDELKPTGPAVGLFKGVAFEVESVTLDPGDMLIAFTDGITDALNQKGERLNKERFSACLEKAHTTVAALLDDIRSLLDAHMNGSHPFDDITVLTLHRKQRSPVPADTKPASPSLA